MQSTSGAVVWIYTQGNRLLIARTKGQDVWKIPGGNVQPGELSVWTLRREIKQGLSVTFKAGSIIWFGDFYDSSEHIRVSAFRGTACHSPVPAGEVEEIAWVGKGDKTEISAKLSDLTKDILKYCIRKGWVT